MFDVQNSVRTPIQRSITEMWLDVVPQVCGYVSPSVNSSNTRRSAWPSQMPRDKQEVLKLLHSTHLKPTHSHTNSRLTDNEHKKNWILKSYENGWCDDRWTTTATTTDYDLPTGATRQLCGRVDARLSVRWNFAKHPASALLYSHPSWGLHLFHCSASFTPAANSMHEMRFVWHIMMLPHCSYPHTVFNFDK